MTSIAPASAGAGDSGDDPLFPPPKILRPDGDPRLLLVADHASSHIPARYQNLGLPSRESPDHWVVDLGTETLCHTLSEHLDIPAVLCSVSRLVIDCNRDPDNDPDCIRTELETGEEVPGNRELDAAERGRRRQYFECYHNAITALLEQLGRRLGQATALLSAHSFSPHIGDEVRQLDIGVLWRDNRRMAAAMMAALEHCEQRPDGVELRENEPYSAYEMAYTMARHEVGLGRLGCAWEIRQDHLGAATAPRWINYLVTALEQCREQLPKLQLDR